MIRTDRRAFFRRLKGIVRPAYALLQRLLRGGYGGRVSPEYSLLLRGQVFDSEYYLEQNPDLTAYSGDLAAHFLSVGVPEGRAARFFDENWYIRTHEDLGDIGGRGWRHYRKFGRAEGRRALFLTVRACVEQTCNRNYAQWLHVQARHDRTTPAILQALAMRLELRTRFSLLVDDQQGLEDMFAALSAQVYGTFECLIAVRPGSVGSALPDDPRFRRIEMMDSGVDALNRLAETAAGDYVVGLDSPDLLDSSALFWLAHVVHQQPDGWVLFADEDCIDPEGTRTAPAFRPDFNYELFLSHNMLGRLVAFRRDMFLQMGGFDAEAGVDAGYDLAMRVWETEGAAAFTHVARVLNHVRGGGAHRVSPAVLQRHFERLGVEAGISEAPEAPEYNRVRRHLVEQPLVSIIIPTRDRVELLRACVESILAKTTYPFYEIIIIDNGSTETATLDYFRSLTHSHIRILRDAQPFNFSALNNGAVMHARGEFVCLMNNDIEIATPDWLEEMLSFAQVPDVGCVGARLWYPDGTLQHGGILVGYLGTAAGHLHKFIRRGDPGYGARAVVHQSLSAVTAAVLLVRKAIYEQVGGLDPALAVAFNDVDFCLRVREAGYRNVYTPYAEMIHYESATRGADSTPAQRQREKTEIEWLQKRHGAILRHDPAYSFNLSTSSEDVSFAFPSRIETGAEIWDRIRPKTAWEQLKNKLF